MEERVSSKPVDVSDIFKIHRKDIYDYSVDIFGSSQAERYLQKIEKSLIMLYDFYLAYPACRYLLTKSRKYRNIILDSHLIIYRITNERIEVLDIIHTSSSIGKIRNVRKIHL